MNRKKVYVIFILLTFVQLATIIYSFQFRKEGTHSDELWSYGYANSFYGRELFMDDDGNNINMNEWLDCKQLWDYLVVNAGEQFRFDSVYYNKQNDFSPFLHSMILHAICSLFPESFSLWYSFAINIISFLVCMIFLFKTAKLLKNEYFAMGCCIWYGFSLAARDTYIYLRMYAMSTAIIMVYLYFSLKFMKKVKEGGKPGVTQYIFLIVVAWIGFMTNFYNISLVGIMTFLICLYFFVSRRIKYMFSYGFSMLGALGLAFLIMPNMLEIASSFNEQVGEASTYFTLTMQVKLFICYILLKTCNLSISIYYSPTGAILFGVLVYIIILMIPLLIFLRKTSFVQGCISKVRYVCSHKLDSVRRFCSWVNWMYVILFVAVIAQIFVTCKTCNVQLMGIYVDRYIFFLYPVAVLLMYAVIYNIMHVVFKNKYVKSTLHICFMLVLIGLNVYTRIYFTFYFFFENVEGQTIQEVVAGKNCIFVNKSGWFLVSMSRYLMNGNAYFHTLSDEYQNYTQDYLEKLEEGPVLLVVNMEAFVSQEETTEMLQQRFGVETCGDTELEEDTAYTDMLDYFENLVPDTEMEQVSATKVFNREMRVFIINP